MNKKLTLIMTAACIGAGTAANYDLLGRHISKSASPVYTKTDALKAKQANEHHALLKQTEAAITKATGRLEQYIDSDKLKTTYLFNDTTYNSSNYQKEVNKYEAKYNPRKNFNGSGAQQTKQNLSLYFSTSERNVFNPSGNTYQEKSRLEKNVTTTYTKLRDQVDWNIPGYRLPKYIGKNVGFYVELAPQKGTGVYLADDTAPNFAEESKTLNACSKNGRSSKQNTQFEATQAWYALHSFIGTTIDDVYYYDYECDIIKGNATQFPLKPHEKNLYMGIHTNSNYEYDANGKYNDKAAYFDDYIYETRMVEVIAEGNLGTNPNSGGWTGDTRSTAAALNAITVGGVEKATGKVAAYNGWKNPQYTSGKTFDKPEIYGYTSYFKIGPSFSIKDNKAGKSYDYTLTLDGSETAATYVGGITQTLLASEPFYRWHPEVVKALLLTSSNIDVMPKDKNGKIDYHNKTFEYKKKNSNQNIVLGATDYKRVFAGNRSAYWIANNFDEIKTGTDKNGKPYLQFNERLDWERDTFRIAISWLSKGSLAKEKGRTPQDFDLYVFNQYGDTLAVSESGDNPFEIVEFETEAPYVTVKIVLYRNDAERILLGYNMHAINYFAREQPVKR